jgi:hypothetical protein
VASTRSTNVEAGYCRRYSWPTADAYDDHGPCHGMHYALCTMHACMATTQSVRHVSDGLTPCPPRCGHDPSMHSTSSAVYSIGRSDIAQQDLESEESQKSLHVHTYST